MSGHETHAAPAGTTAAAGGTGEAPEGTTAAPDGTTAAAGLAVGAPAYGSGKSGSGVRGTLASLAWAVLLPGSMILGAGLGQWMTWIGVTCMMVTVAVAACLIGGVWHRAGAATLASFGGFALMLFAGPAVYEVYMKSVGEPVPAVVTEVTDRHSRRGADMFCTVQEIGGDRAMHEVSQQENCFGQAEVGDRVEIRKDPLGLLDPRLPDGPDQRGTTKLTVEISAGLTLLTAGATFYGSRRRRDG